VSVRYGIGVGASGSTARVFVDEGVRLLRERLVGVGAVLGESRRYDNPAWGGVTFAPFVNAAVVVEVPWTATALLDELFVIERRFGRVRGQKNAARTLDLDVLWSSSPWVNTPGVRGPTIPHPRLRERAFAVRPLVEALNAAGIVVELGLQQASNQHGTAPLTAHQNH
jgi:2-amino-4-hydroxy-6-hydroxymethyldihydropteridine diphosphokinase